MQRGMKVAAGALLAAVIVVALGSIVNRSLGKTKPPGWVVQQPIERIDKETYEVQTLELQEWDTLGHVNGLYKNLKTGKHTMADPMVCNTCGAKIPAAMPPGEVFDQGLDAQQAWMKTIRCPKCGKSPYPPR